MNISNSSFLLGALTRNRDSNRILEDRIYQEVMDETLLTNIMSELHQRNLGKYVETHEAHAELETLFVAHMEKEKFENNWNNVNVYALREGLKDEVIRKLTARAISKRNDDKQSLSLAEFGRTAPSSFGYRPEMTNSVTNRKAINNEIRQWGF